MNEKEKADLIQDLLAYYDPLVPERSKKAFFHLIRESPEFVSEIEFENRAVFLSYLDAITEEYEERFL